MKFSTNQSKSDTAQVESSPVTRKFLPTSYTNIKRDSISSILWVRAKVYGVPLRKSLRTKSITIAKMRADEKIAAARGSWQHKSKRPDMDGWLCKQLADLWASKMEASHLKDSTKTHRRDLLKIIRTNWSQFDGLKPHRVTHDDCEHWRQKMIKEKYSPSTINHCIEILRSIFQEAVARGICFNNPAAANGTYLTNGTMVFIPDPSKPRILPDRKTWAKILKRLRARPDRRRALWRIWMLRYTGQRPSSISAIFPKDVDLETGFITFPPIKHNKENNLVPITRRLKPVLKTLLRLHSGGDTPLVPIDNARKALATACEEAKFRRMKESDFRHFWTTDAQERGLSKIAINAMRGDRPNSTIAEEVYTHARLEHLQAEAKKL